MSQKLRFYVRITDGRFVFSSFDDNSVKASFAPDETEQAKEFVREHQITRLTCSSSVNWPEDYGLDDDFDANEWLERVVRGAYADA